MEFIKTNDTNIEKKIKKSSVKCEYCGEYYKDVEISVILDGKKMDPPIKVTEPNCRCKIKKIEEYVKKTEEERIRQLKENKLQELFKNSMITPFFKTKTFDNLDKNKFLDECVEYAKTFNPKTSKGIQMIGNVGTGKTTLLASICNYLLKSGYKCLFTTFSDLLGKFTNYSSNNAGDITYLLNWITEFDLVCLDDIGRETYTDRRKEIAFQIIDTLMNYEVVTAFTANPEMIEKLKSISEMNAALDRLKDMCPIKYEFRGNSLRGRG